MTTEYYTAEDYRGSPFGPGEPIPYPEGSALHEALAIFRSWPSYQLRLPSRTNRRG